MNATGVIFNRRSAYSCCPCGWESERFKPGWGITHVERGVLALIALAEHIPGCPLEVVK